MEGLIYFLQDNITGIVNAILLILIATGIFIKGEKWLKVLLQIGELIVVGVTAILNDKKLDKNELAQIQKEWDDVKRAIKAK